VLKLSVTFTNVYRLQFRKHWNYQMSLSLPSYYNVTSLQAYPKIAFKTYLSTSVLDGAYQVDSSAANKVIKALETGDELIRGRLNRIRDIFVAEWRKVVVMMVRLGRRLRDSRSPPHGFHIHQCISVKYHLIPRSPKCQMHALRMKRLLFQHIFIINNITPSLINPSSLVVQQDLKNNVIISVMLTGCQ